MWKFNWHDIKEEIDIDLTKDTEKMDIEETVNEIASIVVRFPKIYVGIPDITLRDKTKITFRTAKWLAELDFDELYIPHGTSEFTLISSIPVEIEFIEEIKKKLEENGNTILSIGVVDGKTALRCGGI